MSYDLWKSDIGPWPDATQHTAEERKAMAKTERAMKLPLTMLASELQLGDTVRLFEEPWGTAVVRQIADGQVTFFRPYVHLGSFTHTGGVTPYLGIEDFSVPSDSAWGYLVLRREENLR